MRSVPSDTLMWGYPVITLSENGTRTLVGDAHAASASCGLARTHSSDAGDVGVAEPASFWRREHSSNKSRWMGAGTHGTP